MIYKSAFIIALYVFSFSLWAAPTVCIPIRPLSDSSRSGSSYVRCREKTRLKLPMFPIASTEESSWNDPVIPEAFIITIPNGKVFSKNGIVFDDIHIVKELLWRWSYLRNGCINKIDLPPLEYIDGKVVLLAQEGYANYYHWMVEILPKIAFLEENGIQYDYVYVTSDRPFMKETLQLFGIPAEKILEPLAQTHIEARELIVPSAPSLSCYTPEWVITFLRKKLVVQALQQNEHNFSKKVFISRQKASYRKILNEDEVFSLFAPLGFERYNLEDLSVLDQVRLFNQADVLVAPHGAGLVNLIFANPGCKVIELFQEHEDDTFWYISQVMNLSHTCVKTTNFKKDGGYTNTTIPLSIIEKVIKECLVNDFRK